MTTKTSTPIRIDADLYADATEIAPVMSRSTAQQITHWTRIGRELEASSGVALDQVAEVLRSARSYDSLGTEEQAVIRAHWRERMTALADALRLDREFTAAGRAYVELDDQGQVVRRSPAPAPAAGHAPRA
jgi:ParD-like antitoxin of type II bacterial toxin-antitoxin system